MPASDGDSIANLLRKNKRLSRDLSRMETVFNAIRSAIVVCDCAGEIIFANSYAGDLLGIGAADVSVYKLLPGMDEAVSDARAVRTHCANLRFPIPKEKCSAHRSYPSTSATAGLSR